MTGMVVRIAAQAKLNLHLRILAREDSGFHSLETIFHRIDLADDITIRTTDDGRSIDVEGEDVGGAESNLAFRAAVAYANHCGWPAGFVIELRKRIPVGAGLGGGSADAAAVLRALNFIAPNPADSDGVFRIAASLGSDVPFLASDAVMALAWGRGERMLSLSPLPRCEVLLMTPPFSVSTADAYQWLDEDRALQSENPETMRSARENTEVTDPAVMDLLSLSTWGSIARFARNDFEEPVIARHPEMAGYLEELHQSHPLFAQMTGSGSTIFAVLDSSANNAAPLAEHTRRVTTTTTSINVVQPVRVD